MVPSLLNGDGDLAVRGVLGSSRRSRRLRRPVTSSARRLDGVVESAEMSLVLAPRSLSLALLTLSSIEPNSCSTVKTRIRNLRKPAAESQKLRKASIASRRGPTRVESERRSRLSQVTCQHRQRAPMRPINRYQDNLLMHTMLRPVARCPPVARTRCPRPAAMARGSCYL